MPESPSNRALLIEDLRALVILYRDKPSSLLPELERFLDVNGIGVGQHRREIEQAKKEDIDLLRTIAEEKSNFPGWDAL